MKIAISWGGNDSPGNDSLFDRRGQKALSMPICCTCLIITLMLISEMPANTS